MWKVVKEFDGSACWSCVEVMVGVVRRKVLAYEASREKIWSEVRGNMYEKVHTVVCTEKTWEVLPSAYGKYIFNAWS